MRFFLLSIFVLFSIVAISQELKVNDAPFVEKGIEFYGNIYSEVYSQNHTPNQQYRSHFSDYTCQTLFNGDYQVCDSTWNFEIQKGDTIMFSIYAIDELLSTLDGYEDFFELISGDSGVQVSKNTTSYTYSEKRYFTDTVTFLLRRNFGPITPVKISYYKREELITDSNTSIDFLRRVENSSEVIISTGTTKEIEVQLYSVSGNLLQTWMVKESIFLDMEKYPKSMYLFVANLDGETLSGKYIR